MAMLVMKEEIPDVPKPINIIILTLYLSISGCATLGGNATIYIEAEVLDIPLSWKNGLIKLECRDTCDKSENYEVNVTGNIATISIRNVSKHDLNWRICDYHFCANYSLVIKGKEMTFANGDNNNNKDILFFEFYYEVQGWPCGSLLTNHFAPSSVTALGILGQMSSRVAAR